MQIIPTFYSDNEYISFRIIAKTDSLAWKEIMHINGIKCSPDSSHKEVNITINGNINDKRIIAKLKKAIILCNSIEEKYKENCAKNKEIMKNAMINYEKYYGKGGYYNK